MVRKMRPWFQGDRFTERAYKPHVAAIGQFVGWAKARACAAPTISISTRWWARQRARIRATVGFAHPTAASPIVIPGCARLRADPESSTAPLLDSGFARRRAPRNDGFGKLRSLPQQPPRRLHARAIRKYRLRQRAFA